VAPIASREFALGGGRRVINLHHKRASPDRLLEAADIKFTAADEFVQELTQPPSINFSQDAILNSQIGDYHHDDQSKEALHRERKLASGLCVQIAQHIQLSRTQSMLWRPGSVEIPSDPLALII